jgi:hypothetical protein
LDNRAGPPKRLQEKSPPPKAGNADFYAKAMKDGNVPSYMLDADLEDTETGLNDMAFKSLSQKRVVKKKKKRVIEQNTDFLEDQLDINQINDGNR